MCRPMREGILGRAGPRHVKRSGVAAVADRSDRRRCRATTIRSCHRSTGACARSFAHRTSWISLRLDDLREDIERRWSEFLVDAQI
jgi:hypothetical protein